MLTLNTRYQIVEIAFMEITLYLPQKKKLLYSDTVSVFGK